MTRRASARTISSNNDDPIVPVAFDDEPFCTTLNGRTLPTGAPTPTMIIESCSSRSSSERCMPALHLAEDLPTGSDHCSGHWRRAPNGGTDIVHSVVGNLSIVIDNLLMLGAVLTRWSARLGRRCSGSTLANRAGTASRLEASQRRGRCSGNTNLYGPVTLQISSVDLYSDNSRTMIRGDPP